MSDITPAVPTPGVPADATQDPIVQAVAALLRAQGSATPIPDRLQRPATIFSYDPATNRGYVLIDGDAAPVEAASRVETAPTVGARMMVSFEAPHAVFIVGPI